MGRKVATGIGRLACLQRPEARSALGRPQSLTNAGSVRTLPMLAFTMCMRLPF